MNFIKLQILTVGDSGIDTQDEALQRMMQDGDIQEAEAWLDVDRVLYFFDCSEGTTIVLEGGERVVTPTETAIFAKTLFDL